MKIVFLAPWINISEYSIEHKLALEAELAIELGSQHQLVVGKFSVLAKREDRDDILISNGTQFYIIHLTWSGRIELAPYPAVQVFSSIKELYSKLEQDAKFYNDH